MIDQKNRHLASIAGVDQTRAVDHSYPSPQGVPTPGKNQTRIALRDGDCEAGSDRGPLTWLQRNIDSGLKVDRSIADMCSCGNFHFRIESYETSLHNVVTGHRAGSPDDCKRVCPLTATSKTNQRKMRFSWMESLGFIDSPNATWTTATTGFAPGLVSPSAQTTELVPIQVGKHSRHVEPSGELVRDMWDSTELHAPSLVDWAPHAFSAKTLGRRDYRWPAVVLVAVGALAVAGFGYWLYQQSNNAAASALTEVQTEAGALAVALRQATPLVDDLDADRLPTANQDSTAFFEMDAAARAMFAASADLPSQNSTDRSAAADAAGLTLDATRQLMDATAYRTALEPALTLPILETDPSLTDLTLATAAFSEWRTNFEVMHEALPGGITGQASAALDTVSDSLEATQHAYLDALRVNDSHAAVEVLGGLRAQLQTIRLAMVTDMGEISGSVSGLIDQAQDKLDRLLR